jgi:hypothetical protein
MLSACWDFGEKMVGPQYAAQPSGSGKMPCAAQSEALSIAEIRSSSREED